MGNFKLDEDKIKVISSEFGLPGSGVQQIYEDYNSKINSFMEKQYLGHSIRAIEQFAYVERGKSFHIRCQELQCNPCCLDFGTYFVVYYPPDLTPEDVRFSIAHELGHLFFNTKSREGVYNNTSDQKTLENVASVFGLFVIFGRNAFYSDKDDPFSGAAWQSIVTEYAKICKDKEK
jgi:hypothetical protein